MFVLWCCNGASLPKCRSGRTITWEVQVWRCTPSTCRLRSADLLFPKLPSKSLSGYTSVCMSVCTCVCVVFLHWRLKKIYFKSNLLASTKYKRKTVEKYKVYTKKSTILWHFVRCNLTTKLNLLRCRLSYVKQVQNRYSVTGGFVILLR